MTFSPSFPSLLSPRRLGLAVVAVTTASLSACISNIDNANRYVVGQRGVVFDHSFDGDPSTGSLVGDAVHFGGGYLRFGINPSLGIAEIGPQEWKNGVSTCAGKKVKITRDQAQAWNDDLEDLAAFQNAFANAYQESMGLSQAQRKITLGAQAKKLMSGLKLTEPQLLDAVMGQSSLTRDQINTLATSYAVEPDSMSLLLQMNCINTAQ